MEMEELPVVCAVLKGFNTMVEAAIPFDRGCQWL